MIRTVNGIVLLILHLTVCILIWAGIRSGMLKVKKYLIIPVIFVPVWGALSMLILHLQVFSKAENSRQIGVEKLQVNEEIYKNNFICPRTSSMSRWMPTPRTVFWCAAPTF